MIHVTGRDLFFHALGVFGGMMLNSRKAPCRRACCVEKRRQDEGRERWMQGGDPQEPPPNPSNMMASDRPAWRPGAGPC